MQQQQDTAQTPRTGRSPQPHRSKAPSVFPHCLHCVKPGPPGIVFARPRHEPCTDGNPPTFLPHADSTWGRLSLGNTLLKKRRVPAKSYLMSFSVLPSDPKSTGILFQGGEESDAAMGTKPGRCGPSNSRAYDRLIPRPYPTSSCSGSHCLGQ